MNLLPRYKHSSLYYKGTLLCVELCFSFLVRNTFFPLRVIGSLCVGRFFSGSIFVLLFNSSGLPREN